MAATRTGGIKAAYTNKSKYGEDFYQTIGSIGGKAPCADGAGFKDRELAKRAGRLGGLVSRKAPVPGRIPQVKECSYCGDHGHLAYSCDARQVAIARRKFRNEEIELDRQKNAQIASKWARKVNQ